jgi:hypothetical protein
MKNNIKPTWLIHYYLINLCKHYCFKLAMAGMHPLGQSIRSKIHITRIFNNYSYNFYNIQCHSLMYGLSPKVLLQ